jgi:DNA damage-inducible protein 1
MFEYQLTALHGRPRIAISINAPDEAVDSDLLTLDVPLDLTLRDLKGMVEADTSFPPQSQHFYLNGQALRDDTQTLEQVGIKDGEMLAMMVNRRSGQNQSQQQRQPIRRPADRQAPLDAEHIEAARRRLAADPAAVSHLIRTQPDYAQALNDPQKFRELWEEKHRQQAQIQRERENEIALLNEDPFNPEAQKRIEEIIRKENIEDNLQYAYENNPEGT